MTNKKMLVKKNKIPNTKYVKEYPAIDTIIGDKNAPKPNPKSSACIQGPTFFPCTYTISTCAMTSYIP